MSFLRRIQLWAWKRCRRLGVDRFARRLYVLVVAGLLDWHTRRTVAGETVEFPVTNWYELRRARGALDEEAVLESLLDDLDGDEVVWDIGATVGTYACFLARRLETGRVVAFEPSPANRRRLAENLRANAPAERWRVSPVALTDTDGPVGLVAASNNEADVPGMGHHHLAPDRGRSVQGCRGASLVGDGYAAPDVLKIDVQGAELQVLRGLGEHLDGVDIAYVELHPSKGERYGTDAATVESFLRERGFSLQRLGTTSDGRADLGEDVFHVRAVRVSPESGN